MKEIADAFHQEGGFDEAMCSGASDVFRIAAEETDLDNEKTESRHRRKYVEDNANLVEEGMRSRRSGTQ